MRAAEVGDVEALDPYRRHVEAERVLEPVERVDAALATALDPQAVLVECEARVALGELEDAALVAPLGGAQLDGAAAAAGECLGERRQPGGSVAGGPSRGAGRGVLGRRDPRPPEPSPARPWTSSRWTTIWAGIEMWPA